MTLEIVPESIETDGNLLITFVPAASDPSSVLVLNGATSKKLTYSLTGTGFALTTTQERIADARLALRQTLQKLGKRTDELTLQYVWGGADDVAKPALASGTKGFIVVRYAVANEVELAAGDTVDIIPVITGVQAKDAPTENSVFTITQQIAVTGPIREDVALIA